MTLDEIFGSWILHNSGIPNPERISATHEIIFVKYPWKERRMNTYGDMQFDKCTEAAGLLSANQPSVLTRFKHEQGNLEKRLAKVRELVQLLEKILS